MMHDLPNVFMLRQPRLDFLFRRTSNVSSLGIQALCAEKHNEWTAKFGGLGIKCRHLASAKAIPVIDLGLCQAAN